MIFKMEERFTECKNGGVVHEDDLQYLEEMIKVLKNRQTNITAIISGTGDSFFAIHWGSPLISSPSIVALHAGVTAQQKNIEELKELKRSQDVDWDNIFVPRILFANKAGDLTHDFEKFVVNAKATDTNNYLLMLACCQNQRYFPCW